MSFIPDVKWLIGYREVVDHEMYIPKIDPSHPILQYVVYSKLYCFNWLIEIDWLIVCVPVNGDPFSFLVHEP